MECRHLLAFDLRYGDGMFWRRLSTYSSSGRSTLSPLENALFSLYWAGLQQETRERALHTLYTYTIYICLDILCVLGRHSEYEKYISSIFQVDICGNQTDTLNILDKINYGYPLSSEIHWWFHKDALCIQICILSRLHRYLEYSIYCRYIDYFSNVGDLDPKFLLLDTGLNPDPKLII